MVAQETIDILADARKDLAETQQTLRVSEEKRAAQAEQLRALYTTLNTAGIGITRCNRDLRYLEANQTFATIVGLPLGEIIGRPVIEVLGEAAFTTIRPYIDRVLAGERVEYESVIPYPMGKEIPCSASFPSRIWIPTVPSLAWLGASRISRPVSRPRLGSLSAMRNSISLEGSRGLAALRTMMLHRNCRYHRAVRLFMGSPTARSRFHARIGVHWYTRTICPG